MTASARAVVDSDAPTVNDELGRQAYVAALTSVIQSAETPVVLAIHGAWGTGKTSLMMQIQEQLGEGLNQAGAPPARTVWFDPWMHQFDDHPALGLLHAGANQLGVLDQRNVRDLLTRIGFALAEDITIPFVGLRFGTLARIHREVAESDFNKRSEQAEVREHFHRVLGEVGASDQTRVVFFIDDLDRCQPDVALSLLESLKLYFDLPGCVFVLAVDREPLESAVEAQYRALGLRTESYLDKIIQVPFVIPAIAADEMEDFVRARLPQELRACAEILAAAASDEPRTAKRVSNTLILNHGLAKLTDLGDTYNPQVLALLILLQVQIPSLYRQLRFDPSLLHALRRDETDSTGGVSEFREKYVEDRPRLARALDLVRIDPDLDVSAYLTLTSLVQTERAPARDQVTFDRESMAAPRRPNRKALALRGRKSEDAKSGERLLELPKLRAGYSNAVFVDWFVRVGHDLAWDQPVVRVRVDDDYEVDVLSTVSGRIVSLGGKRGEPVDSHVILRVRPN